MKAFTLRFEKKNKRTFDAIKSGEKQVETRAASTKYKDMQKGDKVTFVCGTSRFVRQVKSAKKFKTFDAMMKTYKVQDITPWLSTREELRATYDAFHGYKEKLKQFGFLAIELE